MEVSEMAVTNVTQLKKFPKFLEELMGKNEVRRMISCLDKFEKKGENHVELFSTWEEQDEKTQFEFVKWLVTAIENLYSSKCSDAHKIGIVNATNRKAIVKEFKKLTKAIGY